ncbi:Molybdenum ABC transporter, periplasmic molybdenum-binding protein ModA [Serinicoccus hydrothermalis]|uniref:Molybdenum ABC transporter, periplasmic molybdenum-binding protein ModA n=1 Tax=Serinicoccus hydrothermalis TaxID=1758689 RepID=A0A1B1NFH9_9MICO|nr:molybdate ABC transporter substrate-binding protein [Serinicoccus hydrothermalis]ANS80125.1 Molybdenum ABC transporter, periplasmic molybdenum-binding protein ModA [Serinicoccus hydrothermalis]
MNGSAGRRAAALALLPALALAGCAAGEDSAGEPAETLTLTVLAAASLTDVLEPVADGFEGDHPGVDVELSFAASSTVVQQVNEGAGADVVALAGEASLEPLAAEHRHGDVVLFATNQLEIAVPVDNTAGIEDLDDLTGSDLTVVACAEQVPCGQAAATLLEEQGLDVQIASYEPDVRATLTKVELGEADAGLVYRTDVTSAEDRVAGVEIPAERNVVNRYPAVAVSEQELAQDFVDDLLSDTVQRTLTDAGFGAAPTDP